MKTTNKCLALLLLLCITMGIFSGCNGVQKVENGHLLDYGTGRSSSGQLNTELYYENRNQVVYGADPGVIYVSEEEDPEYGGWFYMYISAEKQNPGSGYESKTALANECYRSRDMVAWEKCGALDGFALISAADDWTLMNMWAPEVYRHPEDGKYYMYYSAQKGNKGRQSDPLTTNYDRLYLAVAVSDSPMGPFKVVRSGTDANGNEITNAPIFDFAGHFELDTCFSAIDSSVFRDEDGTLYLTFAKHEDTSGFPRGIWGLKLTDPVTPDYTTLTCLTIHSQKSVQDYPVGTITKPVSGGAYNEETLNEGNFINRVGDKYYLTYSIFGYGDKGYCVMQAVSDSPLGPYVKPDWGKGNPVVNTVATSMSYLAGTGHHSIVQVGDELFSVFHHHGNPQTYSYAPNRRVIGIDRLDTAEIDGQQVLVCNGPTYTPQYKSAAISGYENIAATAKVSVTGGTGTEYLNDGYLSASASMMEWEFLSDGKVTVSLQFPEAVPVSAVMVYNSNDYERAFSSIDEIRLYYDSPRMLEGTQYDFAAITELPFPERDVNPDEFWICQGAAAIADFNEITVNKITITISQKYVTEEVDGSPLPQIGISDIVVLSKTAK